MTVKVPILKETTKSCKMFVETLKGIYHSEGLNLDWKIILTLGKKVWVCGLHSLAQDRVKWWALVNMVMNLWIIRNVVK
jgi:hypothetical protein